MGVTHMALWHPKLSMQLCFCIFFGFRALPLILLRCVEAYFLGRQGPLLNFCTGEPPEQCSDRQVHGT